jgi:hypothetical protein
MFMTCFSYMSQLVRSEQEWLVTAHEHLNSIDDYLDLRCPSAKSTAGQPEPPPPGEAFTFVDSLKNSLISHETNIEQIRTMRTELQTHAQELSLQLDLSAFSTDYGQLCELRARLLARLRASGLTACSSLHHLLKQCFGRLRALRALKNQPEMGGGSQTGSLRTSAHHYPPTNRPELTTSSASNSLNRQQHAQCVNQAQVVGDLRAYYRAARAEFNHWMALESYIISYYCTVAQEQLKPTSGPEEEPEISSAHSIQPSRVLKFTIRRCEVGVPFFLLRDVEIGLGFLYFSLDCLLSWIRELIMS